MKTKLMIILMIGLLLVSAFLIIIQNTDNKIKLFDCNEFGVIYLKPSEREYASEFADKINGIVVIPEENSLIARSEILDCPNFDYSEYINFGDKS